VIAERAIAAIEAHDRKHEPREAEDG